MFDSNNEGYRQVIIESALALLYNPIELALKKDTQELIYDHLRIINKAPTGRVHIQTNYSKYSTMLKTGMAHHYYDLDPSLDSRAHDLHKQYLLTGKEESRVANFIRITLNTIESEADIARLLPTVLVDCQNSNIKTKIYNSVAMLNDHITRKFRIDNKETIDIINKRALSNILLR